MKSVLWLMLWAAVLMYTHGTFEEIRQSKYLTPLSIDLAFIVMAFVGCCALGLL